jgi:hypothetical protein
VSLPYAVAKSPSMQAVFGATAAANINIWVALCVYCSVAGAGDLLPGANNNFGMVGFRHFSSNEATTWTCYLGNDSNGSTAATGVTLDTSGVNHLFDVIEVGGVYEFFIDKVQVCSSISQAYQPPVTETLGVEAVWQSTTTTSVSTSVGHIYLGSN